MIAKLELELWAYATHASCGTSLYKVFIAMGWFACYLVSGVGLTYCMYTRIYLRSCMVALVCLCICTWIV